MRSMTALGASFARHKHAEARSPETLRIYRSAIRSLAASVEDDLDACTRRAVTDWISTRLDQVKASSVNIEFRALRVFFRWLVDEGELPVSPFDRVKQPKVRLAPPKVYSDSDLKALVRACKGASFSHRRDAALIRLLLDTGMRRGELAGIKLDEVDLDAGVVAVTGKTGTRVVPFGAQSAIALDRYMRLRARTSHSARPELWVGEHGPMTGSGVYQAIQTRATKAGVVGAFVHRLGIRLLIGG